MVAYALSSRPAVLPYSLIVINQNAAKVWREDFVNAMTKILPEFVKDEAN
jgi:hypothetical protein